MALTDYEEDLRQSCFICGGHCTVTTHEYENALLFWPDTWLPQWYEESGVKDVRELACWLDRAYQQMTAWTEFDPNEYYSCKNDMRHRLAFVCNGKWDFQFENDRGEPLPRPYIGLRDGQDPKCGSEDWFEWFGWLCHELSHDFLHEPRLGPDAAEWGEGLCNYFRCKLLSALGMVQAADDFECRYVTPAAENDKYNQPAKLLLAYEREHRFASPGQLVRRLRGKYLSREVGPRTWET